MKAMALAARPAKEPSGQKTTISAGLPAGTAVPHTCGQYSSRRVITPMGGFVRLIYMFK
jgi:hypothetical protein